MGKKCLLYLRVCAGAGGHLAVLVLVEAPGDGGVDAGVVPGPEGGQPHPRVGRLLQLPHSLTSSSAWRAPRNGRRREGGSPQQVVRRAHLRPQEVPVVGVEEAAGLGEGEPHGGGLHGLGGGAAHGARHALLQLRAGVPGH